MDLTLYTIESDLRALVEMSEELEPQLLEAVLTGQDSAELEAALAKVNAEIEAYLVKEIRKVDGVRDFWRTCEKFIETAKEEGRRQMERAREWDTRLTRLKAMCVTVMQSFEWQPRKPRRLEGARGSISLKGNGGVQPVTITDIDLVPDEYKEVTVNMNVATWNWIKGVIWEKGAEEVVLSLTAKVSTPVARLDRIRTALESTCGHCGGHSTQCACCGGTGKQGIPGARLDPRGEQVECK